MSGFLKRNREEITFALFIILTTFVLIVGELGANAKPPLICHDAAGHVTHGDNFKECRTDW